MSTGPRSDSQTFGREVSDKYIGEFLRAVATHGTDDESINQQTQIWRMVDCHSHSRIAQPFQDLRASRLRTQSGYDA